jgi:hypothetical protein
MNFPPLVSNTNIHAVLKSCITNLYFILHRNQEDSVRLLIREIFTHLIISNRNEFYESLLRRIVIHTRNIQNGKGERTVFYVCVFEWFSYNQDQAIDIIDYLVYKSAYIETSNVEYTKEERDEINRRTSEFKHTPYGSWRDIRAIAEYVYQTENADHPLIQYCILLMNHQLTKDYFNFRIDSGIISNVVKWIPRERSKWKWMFDALVEKWPDTPFRENKNKSCMKYRKMCSSLNAHLPTLLTGGKGSAFVYPSKITSDLEWQKSIEKHRLIFGSFANVLPMIDARLEGRDMNTAIGLSLAIAELSSFGKRILCMGHNPAWISIPPEYGLTQSVKHLSSCLSESPLCRIEQSIGLLIQSFVDSGMTSADIEQVCLVLFSSMDFGEVMLHDKIQSMFLINSMQIPHIVYWGISTNVLPCAFDTPRTTLVSGESSSEFQMISDMNLSERRNLTPYLAVRRNL